MIHFEQQGTGETVILIHGLFGSADNLNNLGRHLASHYHVVRVDVPNHGKSPHWQQMSYAKLSLAIKELMDYLQLGHCHLVGHSMGGKIAMATAQAYPDSISSVVAADISPVKYPPRHDAVFSALHSTPLSELTSRNQALQHLIACGLDEGTAMFLIKNLHKGTQGFEWRMNLHGLQQAYADLIDWLLHNYAITASLCVFVAATLITLPLNIGKLSLANFRKYSQKPLPVPDIGYTHKNLRYSIA